MEFLYTRKLCAFSKTNLYQKKNYYLIFLGITKWDKVEPVAMEIQKKLLILQPLRKISDFDKDKYIIKNFLKDPKRRALIIDNEILKKMEWDENIRTVFVYYNSEKEICLIGDYERIREKIRELNEEKIEKKQENKVKVKKEKIIDRLLKQK